MSVSRIYQQLKNIYHFCQAHFWRIWYGRPDKGMAIYGVTGTNGKTTTCILVGNILRAAHGPERVGLLATIVFWLGAEEVVNESKMTTLDSRDVFRYLKTMKQKGVTHMVLEMTSHALDQHRLSGIGLEGAIITNIAREHSDYHKTMGAYAEAKLRIIKYLKPKAPLVLKGDDEFLQKSLSKFSSSNFQFSKVEFTADEAKNVQTPLLGDVNKENVLAATKLMEATGVPSQVIARGVASVTHVPGRMEWVESPKGFRVLIDYAVTPDALERLYAYAKREARGKVYGILGAAGLRDRGKRPDMARVVAQYADELVLTREDPWTESEEQIFGDLEKGLPPLHPLLRKEGQKNIAWRRIVDRREALKYVLSKARAGDIVVVTGKGAERGMGVGKEVIPWNEREVVRELLQ